jgi:hypothetical protein
MPLTPEIVTKAWQMLQAGRGQASVARELGIPKSTINTLVARETWRHVTDGLGDLPPAKKGRPFRAPTIDQDKPPDDNRSDLSSPPRRRRRDDPGPALEDDISGRTFLRREVSLIHRVAHRYPNGGSP